MAKAHLFRILVMPILRKNLCKRKLSPCFSHNVEILLASGFQLSIPSSGTAVPRVISLDWSLAGSSPMNVLFFHCKYEITRFFPGWSELGDVIAAPLLLGTDVPFGTPNLQHPKVNFLCLRYRRYSIGIMANETVGWYEFLLNLQDRVESTLSLALSEILREGVG